MIYPITITFLEGFSMNTWQKIGLGITVIGAAIATVAGASEGQITTATASAIALATGIAVLIRGFFKQENS